MRRYARRKGLKTTEYRRPTESLSHDVRFYMEQSWGAQLRMQAFDMLHPNCRKYNRINGSKNYSIDYDCMFKNCEHPYMHVEENMNE